MWDRTEELLSRDPVPECKGDITRSHLNAVTRRATVGMHTRQEDDLLSPV